MERYLKKEVPEALLRSCLFVLVDNATAEYSFITNFFTLESIAQPVSPVKKPDSNLFSRGLLSADDVADDAQSNSASDILFETPRTVQHANITLTSSAVSSSASLSKDDQTVLSTIWKQILDPALDRTQVSLAVVLSISDDLSY
jgi:vacuolar protein sorting-associated protein 52